MKISIHQPNYLPYLGFVDKAKKSDIFVIYDDAQFSKGDWHNRNKIRMPKGWTWLTVPVKKQSGRRNISEIQINNSSPWASNHLSSFHHGYRRSKYYKDYESRIKSIYTRKYEKLIDLNMAIINFYWSVFSITSEIVLSSSLGINSIGTRKLIDITKSLDGDVYVSGGGAGDYLDIGMFQNNGLGIEIQDFEPIQYKQTFPGFEPNLSAVDALFNIGPDLDSGHV